MEESNKRYTVAKHNVADEKLIWWVHDSVTGTIVAKCRFRRQGVAIANTRNSVWQRACSFQAFMRHIASEFSVTDRKTGKFIKVNTISVNGSMVLLGFDVEKLAAEVTAPGTLSVAA